MDQALGCLWGAAVGDAVGAFLEFRSVITEELLDRAFALPGGGPLGAGPGQITDDTELAIALADALAHQSPADGFPANDVATNYVRWFRSKPFDIGRTCRNAMSLAPTTRDLARRMQERALEGSGDSKANGALMRATPIAIWAHRLATEEVAALAAADALLTHPNITLQHCNAAYCIAAASLIRQPGDVERALALTGSWVAAHAEAEVRGWWAEAQSLAEGKDELEYDARPLMGFVKHAFILAFVHLRRSSTFDEGLRHTLLCGGDTDTNGAIVGGLLGALHGASGIDENLRRRVRDYRWRAEDEHGYERPEFFKAKRVPELAEALFAAASGQEGGRGGEAH